MSSARLGLFWGLCPALFASDAHADEATTAANRATQAFRAADYARALTAFEEAVSIVERGQGDTKMLPVLKFNLARCLEELSRPAEAIVAFERYLALPDTEASRKRANERIVNLELRNFARLFVECAPAEGDVYIDGRLVGRCNADLARLKPGATEVRAQQTDGRTVSAKLTLRPGVESRPTLTFPGRIRVDSSDGVVLVVQVDGKPVSGPPYQADVAAGPHRVDVARADGRSWRRDVNLEAGGTHVVSPSQVSASGISGGDVDVPRAVLSFGAAALTLGTGAYFWVDALGSADDARAAISRHNASDDVTARNALSKDAALKQGEAESSQMLAYGLAGAGALLAGVAAYFIVVGDESEGHPTSRLDLGPGGLTWTASF